MADDSTLRIDVDARGAQANLDKLDKSLKKVEKSGKKTATSASKIPPKLKKVEDGARATASSFKALTAAAIAFGTVGFGASVFQTVRSVQSLKAQLKTLLGDMESANGAFEELQEFAAKTPFALEQSISAFQKLTALGLEPSERALYSYGNTASAMGKDLNQLIEAVADASTGEFERLKEFGIKAKKEGDQIGFTFQGVTTQIQNNAADIQEYLISIGETSFSTAMIDQMNSLNGQMSNLGDAWEKLKYEIGKGLEQSTFLVDVANALDYVRERVPVMIAQFKSFRQFVFFAFDSIVASMKKTYNNLSIATIEATGAFKLLWAKAIDAVTSAFGSIVGGLASFAEIFSDSEGLAGQLRKVQSAAMAAAGSEAQIRAQVEASVAVYKQRNNQIDEELGYRRQVALANEAEYRAIIDAGTATVDNGKKLDDYVKKREKADKAAEEAAKAAAKAEEERLQTFKQLSASLRDQVQDQEFLATTIGKTADEIEILNFQRKVQETTANAATAAERELVRVLAQQGEAQIRANQASRQRIDDQERANDLVSDLDNGLTSYNTTLEEYNDLRGKGLLTDEQYLELLEDLKIANKDLLSEQEKLNYGLKAGIESYVDSVGDSFDKIKSITESTAKNMEDTLTEFLNTGKFGFKEFADSVLNDMNRMAAKALTADFMEAIGGAFGVNTGFGGGTPPIRQQQQPQMSPAQAGGSAAMNALMPQQCGNPCEGIDIFSQKTEQTGSILDMLPGKIESSMDKGASGFSKMFQNFQSGFGDLLSGFGDSFSGIFDSLTSSLGSMFSSLGGGGGGGGGGFGQMIGSAIGSMFGMPMMHSGGIVGKEGTPILVNPTKLPKYHSGIGPNEQMALLEKDEGVFTKGQMKNMASLQDIKNAVGGNTGPSSVSSNINFSPTINVDAKGAGPEVANKIKGIVRSELNSSMGMMKGMQGNGMRPSDGQQGVKMAEAVQRAKRNM